MLKAQGASWKKRGKKPVKARRLGHLLQEIVSPTKGEHEVGRALDLRGGEGKEVNTIKMHCMKLSKN